VLETEFMVEVSDSGRWEKFEFPPKSMAFVDKIVFSKGLDVNVIRLSMEEYVPPQILYHPTDESTVLIKNKFKR
jgi:hypothetical protein